MRTQIILLSVLPIAFLGAFASIHGAYREAKSRQAVWINAQAGKILLAIVQDDPSTAYRDGEQIRAAAVRLGLNARVVERRLPDELDLRPARRIDGAVFSAVVQKLVSTNAREGSAGSGDVALIAIRISDGQSVMFLGPTSGEALSMRGVIYVLGLAMLVVLPVLLLSYYLSCRLTSPLIKFAEDARRVSEFEEPLEPFQAEGAFEVRSLRDSLNTMQSRIRSMTERRTMMLRALGHDLRTPLTRLRIRVERSREPKLRHMLLRDIEMLIKMIEETVLYIEPSSDRRLFKKVDLSSLLQTITYDYADLGLEIIFRGPSRFVYICHGRNISRAIVNLVDNASRVSERIELKLSRTEDGSPSIEVSDNGPGLSSEMKMRVLEPFFKVDTARKGGNSGLGLGLSIARGIIQAHGGQLELIDNMPHGLTARIILPPCPEAPAVCGA